MKTNEKQSQLDTVRTGYAQIAEQEGSCCGGGACCGPTVAPDELAERIGYSAEEIAELPEGANMGLSCGNPGAIASLKLSEVVIDLGSGGGFDVFLAGPKVGATGRVIGIDMTPEMLAKARRNTESYTQSTGLDNVEFRLGEIEHIPVADASADVVMSNCVLNLSPDQAQVWREIARVLKPGGRAAISDLALLQPLPGDVAEMAEALIGCIAGAALVEDVERMAREAGLEDVRIEKKGGYIEALGDDPLVQKITDHLPAGTTPSDYITSLLITARRP
ncbi:MAG: methyltransferase domain-containing protein [Phycisphaeraceae bacterium]|nr:MAG: methyltransferase domain-containing protein [Phycisphaeraceae bacterium]